MNNFVSFAQYGGTALIIALPAAAVGLGQGLASRKCMIALDRQPKASNDLRRTLFLGMALSETTAIMSMLMAFLLLGNTHLSAVAGPAILGIIAAIIIPAVVAGFGSGFPVYQALTAIARQPLFGKKIGNIMLITVSFLQTPIIFGFIIALLIYNQLATISSFDESLRLCASGIAVGLGCVGPEIGMVNFAQKACESLGINPDAYTKIVPFAFVNQALIETPLLFAFSIALLLLNWTPVGIFALSAALAIGLSTLGTGISTGRIGAAACQEITQAPESYIEISRTSLLAQTFVDTCAIYGLIIAIMLLI